MCVCVYGGGGGVGGGGRLVWGWEVSVGNKATALWYIQASSHLLPAATTAPPESNRSSLAPPTTTPTASGITYSSLWPSSKDVVGASIPNLAPDN